MRYLLLLLMALSYSMIQAQPVLGDPINDGVLPDDDDLICDIPIYPYMLPYTMVMSEDSLVPDFTLFDLDNNPYNLSDIMTDGKPVLLIGCSYTCYVFRGKQAAIDTIADYFSEDVNVFLVYTVEAHPYGDISPYFGYEYPGEDNITDGILYPQPTTYEERKEIASDMVSEMDLPDLPVLLDDPCNNFWLNYGAFPVPAILIDTDGIVYDYQEWLGNYPDDIMMSLYEILGGEVGEDPTPEGSFDMGAYSEECLTDVPGTVIIHHVELVNTDTEDAYIGIDRVADYIPDGWDISLCTDICYSPDVLEVSIYVPAGDTAGFSVYFYTDEDPGEGETDLYIHQMFTPDINYSITLKACTDGDIDTTTAIIQVDDASLQVYPNPATDQIILRSGSNIEQDAMISFLNMQGQVMFEQLGNGQRSVILYPGLPAGNYILRLQNDDITSTKMITIQ